MSYVTRQQVQVATDASGDAAAYTQPLTGWLVNIIYTKGDFADGVDFTITAESSGIGLWTESDVNASKMVSPTQPIHDQLGVGRLYASGGEAVGGPIYLAQDRVKIVVANGGNVKSGTFEVIVAGPTG